MGHGRLAYPNTRGEEACDSPRRGAHARLGGARRTCGGPVLFHRPTTARDEEGKALLPSRLQSSGSRSFCLTVALHLARAFPMPTTHPLPTATVSPPAAGQPRTCCHDRFAPA